MYKLSEARRFINQERTYAWLVIFLILINAGMLSQRGIVKPSGDISQPSLREEITLKEEALREALQKKPALALLFGLAGLLGTLVLILGLGLNIKFLIGKFKGRRLIERGLEYPLTKWTIWDVCKVVILFLFFGYIIHLIEGILSAASLFKMDEHFRMALNTLLMDGFALGFIIYFVVVEYGQRIKSLGLQGADFLRNVFLGLTGYITALPILASLLVIILSIAHLINYQPPPQPVFNLLFETEDLRFLLFSILLVALIGPIIEEIFFRGFMYSAIRARFGIKQAIIASSVLFSLVHGSFVGFLPIMGLGILLAYLYERTGSLIPCITVHILHNSVMVSFVFLFKGIISAT